VPALLSGAVCNGGGGGGGSVAGPLDSSPAAHMDGSIDVIASDLCLFHPLFESVS